MQQTWTSKNITSQVYQNTLTQTTYASISQSYTSDKLTGYTYNIKAGMTNFSDTVTPSYVSTGTMKEKLDTLTYSGSGRVITYGYDANGNRTNAEYVTGADNRLLSDGTYWYWPAPQKLIHVL